VGVYQGAGLFADMNHAEDGGWEDAAAVNGGSDGFAFFDAVISMGGMPPTITPLPFPGPSGSHRATKLRPLGSDTTRFGSNGSNCGERKINPTRLQGGE